MLTTGKRPMNSGINPNASKSSGSTAVNRIPRDGIGIAKIASMESHRRPSEPALNNLVKANKGAAANEKNFFGIHLDVFLVRMFAAALRRHIADCALENFQKRLLHTFAGNVARDADVFRLATDLVDLVDVDDAHLGALDVVIGILKKPQNDVLDILADVTGFGDSGRIGDAKRDIEDPRQSPGQQRLAGTGGPDQQNVAFLDLDLGERTKLVNRAVERRTVLQDALVVIVHRNREDLLGFLLADDMLVEFTHDLRGLGHADGGLLLPRLVVEFLVENPFADGDAAIANVDARARR